MSNESGVVFRRIRGRVVPVQIARKTAAAGVVVGAGAVASRMKTTGSLKPNQALRAIGGAASVASGVLAGATLFSKGKNFWAATAGSLALDGISYLANTAAYAGHGHLKKRAKGVAKQTALTEGLGYAAFAGAAFGLKKNRMRSLVYVRKAVRFSAGLGGKLIKVVL